MNNSIEKTVLYDTYLTDISAFGSTLILKEEGKKGFFSRSYQKGELVYEKSNFPCDCICFGSGNIQITALYGSQEELRPFLNRLNERQRRRWFPLTIRKFVQYLYILSSLGIGFLTFVYLCQWRISKFLLGFLILFLLRVLYSGARNLIK